MGLIRYAEDSLKGFSFDGCYLASVEANDLKVEFVSQVEKLKNSHPSEVAAEWATAEVTADCKVEAAEWATADDILSSSKFHDSIDSRRFA